MSSPVETLLVHNAGETTHVARQVSEDTKHMQETAAFELVTFFVHGDQCCNIF